MHYKYTAQQAVLSVFASATKRQRDELLRVFLTLAEHPYTLGEWRQKDDSGRDCQVKRIGRWLVTYWPDHLGNTLHIVDVEKLA